MMLADLLATLVARQALRAKRTKDYQTSLRYLAAALGHDSPATCPLDTATRDIDTWLQALEAHFQALTAQGRIVSAATMRNSRNNIRVIFRAAEAQGLLTAPLPVPLLVKPHRRNFRRRQKGTTPYQASYRSRSGLRRYALPQCEWPPDVQAGWQDYQARCGMRLRETTLQGYAYRLALYLGYVRNVVGRQPTWEDCFDPAQLRAFARWHARKVERSVSVFGRQVVVMLAAMAKVIEHPNARALADLRNALPTPEPLHVKRAHWVSLAKLEEVAEACLTEGRAPLPVNKTNRHPGAQRASQFQKGVILKLLVRIPLRQRNVRELQLDRNLYQDQAEPKHWHIHFAGSELKVGTRKGRINEYHVNLTEYCPDLLPLLEEWRTVYRPRLPGAATSPLLFLTKQGRQFTTSGLGLELTDTVAMRTNQRFYPHLIRTIWATEYLTHPDTHGDYQTAATMLGDDLAMVIETYCYLVNKDQHAKAKAFLAKALRAG
jgi:hypothetical protein